MSYFQVGKTYLGFYEGNLVKEVAYKCLDICGDKVTFVVKGTWNGETMFFKTTLGFYDSVSRTQLAIDEDLGIMVNSDYLA